MDLSAIEKVKEGQYFYMVHRRCWGVWQKTSTGNTHIADFPTREKARDKVYRLNGWFSNKQ